MSLSTVTVSGLHTRLTSFLPRSTSMMCSARSLGSSSSSFASASSSAGVLPRRRVPAIGCVYTIPSSTLTSISGDAPTTVKSLRSR
ncbi:hypothetical protein BC937DRAFT_95325 [Endogone sp. FLAS-F59071]|nr:hypothetical protein BC937DRAFT_95325 [Endogone sp. FLAS-F59071]|eukprot:RUS22895.1 hypothetical protein BC937DRAFT_95325 [Endogone sp. FLAS-F59071]